MKRIVFLVILVGLCASFRSKSVKEIISRYRSWYAENGESLNVKRSKTNIDFQLTYHPYEIEVVNEIKDKEKVTTKEIEELVGKYNQFEEYSLKISTKGVRDFLLSQSFDRQDYDTKLYYLIENITNDFRMVLNETDSIKPLRCDFENNYGTAPFINFRLLFDKPNYKASDKKIIYADVLFANDTIQFNLNQLLHLTIPQL